MHKFEFKLHPIGRRIFVIHILEEDRPKGSRNPPVTIEEVTVKRVTIEMRNSGRGDSVIYHTTRGAHEDQNVFKTLPEAEAAMEKFGYRSVCNFYDEGTDPLYVSTVLGVTSSKAGFNTPVENWEAPIKLRQIS